MVSSHSLLKVPWCEERGVPRREDEGKQLVKSLGFVSISPSKAGQESFLPSPDRQLLLYTRLF